MTIVYDPVALAQIDAIAAYIQRHNRAAARRVALALRRSFEQLATFPRSGRPSEVPGVRELLIVRYPYIVFYTIDGAANDVIVLRVRQTSQDPRHHLD